MNGLTLAIVGLRAAALALLLAGDKRSSDRLYTLADLVEAGKATDDHMALVAEKLKNRDITDADWDEVMSRIEEDSNRLQSS
jgi:hypothetical protein